MRNYINQINDKLINMIFTSEELEEYREITSNYNQVKNDKRRGESEAKNKLASVVIGELDGIQFNFSAYSGDFYMSYTNPNPSYTLWDRIIFLFTGRLETK